MGVSTDGILCYGFGVRDAGGEFVENELPDWLERAGGNFERFLAELVGLSPPESEDKFNKSRYDSDPIYADGWNQYWKRKRGLEKELGVSLVYHCSGDYPMFILAAEESVKTAGRGDPFHLGQCVKAKLEWRGKLLAFCNRAGIKFEEPQFILCSYWG